MASVHAEHLANLCDSAGHFPDCEASTEHLSPGVVLSGRVSGQSDRTQSNQIWVAERDQKVECHENRRQYCNR